jgi:hypothetical protein
MGGFVNAMPVSRTVYDYSKFEETEFALAISPCPQIAGSRDIGENTQFARKRSGLDRRRQVQMSRQTAFQDDGLTGILSMGLAIIALAITGLLVVYFSGG